MNPERMISKRAGLLVVIDGIDGCGKTTQVAALKDRLTSSGFGCVASREPTGGKWGQILRQTAITGRLEPRAELEVILNDRRDDVNNCILPALSEGLVVVLDRYYTSSLAYQSIRGLDPEEILALNGEFPTPDLIFLLQIDAQAAQDRIVGRSGVPDSFEDLEEQRHIAQRFDALSLPGICRLDATLPPKQIEAIIYRTVCQRLLSGRNFFPSASSCPEVEGSAEYQECGKGINVRDLGYACEHYGVFFLREHRVSLPLLRKVTEEARAFFDLPLELKMESFIEGRGRGYLPIGGERLSSTLGEFGPGDLKESLNIGPNDGHNPTISLPSSFGESLRDLYDSFNEFAQVLFREFAASLDIPRDSFSQFISEPKAILRITHYPKIDRPPEKGQLRATPHTDYGCMTILFPDHKVGGLQIYLPNLHWINVIAPPDALIIHVGDVMERWTNGRYTSPLHRVIVPEKSGFDSLSRLSIVFLHNPNPDALVEALPQCRVEGEPSAFPSIRADEHLKSKSIASRNHNSPPLI